MADRHGRNRVNLKVERVTARDTTLLVVFLPGVGVDPIVEVLLQTAVEGGLIKEEVHPDQQVLRVVARGEGERFLRQHFRHDRERPGWVSGRLALDRRDVVDAAISLAVVDGVEQERAAALVALDVGIGEGSLGVFSPVEPSSTAIFVPAALQASAEPNLLPALVKTTLPVVMKGFIWQHWPFRQHLWPTLPRAASAAGNAL